MTDKRSAPSARTAHPSFDFVRLQPVDSLGIEVAEYRHRKTGAVHFHIDAEHQENVFLVALRTIPGDSTGVAHILEHTALCGSERFPVRDPFFMMTRRSLNTFMNAFTSSDWTAYPFASQNRKDFFNLLEVYLDAVFFSRLDPLDFAQEGHRVEFSEAADPSSELTYKGVVFNEMKGAMSSPVSVLWQTLSKYLFPTTTYHFNSGGEPECIPDLSYDDLIRFYRTHYHPSNAVFMTFGDIPAAEQQERFETLALARFDKLDAEISVSDEKRYHAPLKVEEAYALDEEDTSAKTHVVVGWLLGLSTDLEDQLEAHLLSRVLLDNSASPLRYALESSDLGASPSPLCGLEDSNREMSFMCGMEGSEPEYAEAIEALVLEVLQRVASEGVPQEHVEAVLHQLELSQREIGGDGYPYGLQLILAGLSTAVHRGDPISLLNLDPVLEQLQERIKDRDYIPSLVQRLLLDNPHRVRVTLRPDRELAKRRDAAERARLAAIKAKLDEQQAAAIVAQAAALEARQQQLDDESILPKVGLGDVPEETRIPEGEVAELGYGKRAFYGQGTNGIVYQEVLVEMPELTPEEQQLLPLYSLCLTELGVGERDYQQTQAWQSAITGGVSAFATVRGDIDDPQSVRGYFTLCAKSLNRNVEQMVGLLKETFFTIRFDELSRMRELVSQQRARKQQSITGSGHALAMMAAASELCPSAQLSHRQRGLAAIGFLKQLDESLKSEEGQQRFADQLKTLHAKLTTAPRHFLCVAEPEMQAPVDQALATAWSGLAPATEFSGFRLDPISQQVKQAWSTSTQVNFCAKAYATVPVEHSDSAPLVVLGDFLRNGYLHRAVREKGGAYGGGAGQDSSCAAFRFFSYRDPRIEGTLDDFDAALRWLVDGDHSDNKLEEAILGVVSSIDKPGSPAGEAKQAYHSSLFGRTPMQRRAFRARVLKVTLDDLKRVARTYLIDQPASIAVITDPDNAKRLQGEGYELLKA
ncbi:insulinase family protein [Motiliproteus sediminis]|uniref:insulinase family protein n=1 Tax=Motiliproteus sediminis TaxID=1468178 RepID=UPI001AF02192|nr:insulinase family protein [Motiliproteus sediminis]